MIYLKTISIILLFSLFINSPIFVDYYDIKYYNLLYILAPIVGMAIVYFLFDVTTKRRIDPKFLKFKLNPNLAVLLSLSAALIMAKQFDLNSFLIGDIAKIRGDYIDRTVGFWDQIAPLLLIYPFIYVMYCFASQTVVHKFKLFLVLGAMIFFGLSTGGRAFVFNLAILYLLIAKPKIISLKYLPFFVLSLVLFAFITLGRFNNIDSNKAAILEAGVPLVFKDYLKDRTTNAELKDLTIEFIFYFGQGIPAFCNKFENLDFTILPRSVWGLQPFVERQLIRAGLLSHNQMERYDEITDLSIGSGFFKESWSTGFLDVYFHEGKFLSLAFFFFAAFVLFITQRNLRKTASEKYKIISGYNQLFIITMFMTPAFMETVAFFSYVMIFCSQIQLNSAQPNYTAIN